MLKKLISTSLFAVLSTSALACTDEKAIETLALNMYHEARGESYGGLQMVGEVTLNRVESSRYPDTICEVVYQRKQFSWTHSVKDHTPYETDKWEESLEIAEALIEGDIEYFDNGATHFLNPNKVKKMPRWARQFEVVGKVGNHVFYKYDS